jgi:hypothetical protein
MVGSVIAAAVKNAIASGSRGIITGGVPIIFPPLIVIYLPAMLIYGLYLGLVMM